MSALPREAVARYTRTRSPDAHLMQQHAGLVKRIAYHLAARLPASVEIDDLIQAGSIGLLEAARNFQGDRGASFETYAGIRIRGAMLDELRRGDWAPRSLHRRARDVESAMRAIEQETGREAKDSEIAERMGVSLNDYFEAVTDAARCQVLSTEGFAEDSEGYDAPADDADPDGQVTRAEFQAELIRAIGSLPEREKLVMSLYYERELNLKEIGKVLDVSESRVCQIHGQALVRLRARLGDWASVALG
ncbi:MAG: polymerase sigma factor FliA [Panacagrimonas sp.]|jgi:RNA polymerase sigma factor for flagellar operon FliA|nr:RNA polymerase sigma factor FliA [Panacagrimonas sp.]MCC2655952.1 polymerase sigma factor FliA [Panacagrimonas sp.]